MSQFSPLDKRRPSEDSHVLLQQAISSLDVGILQEIDAKARLKVYIESCLQEHYAAKAAEARAQRINAMTQAIESLEPAQIVAFIKSLNV